MADFALLDSQKLISRKIGVKENQKIFTLCKTFHSILTILNIGGHGFSDKGGVDTGGCLKKNFSAAFGGRKFLRRRRHRGVKNFFRRRVYLVDRGVILPKKPKKWPHRGVKNFFPRGASHPGVHPPPVFFAPGVGQIFGLRGGCTPPPPPPVPIYVSN